MYRIITEKIEEILKERNIKYDKGFIGDLVEVCGEYEEIPSPFDKTYKVCEFGKIVQRILPGMCDDTLAYLTLTSYAIDKDFFQKFRKIIKDKISFWRNNSLNNVSLYLNGDNDFFILEIDEGNSEYLIFEKAKK